MDGVKDGIVSYNNLLYYSIITTVENGEQEKNTVWFYKKFFRCFFWNVRFFFSISRIFGILTSINNWTTPLHHFRQNQLHTSIILLLFFEKKKKRQKPVAVIIYYLLTKKIILFT